jgi:hypothetical protein
MDCKLRVFRMAMNQYAHGFQKKYEASKKILTFFFIEVQPVQLRFVLSIMDLYRSRFLQFYIIYPSRQEKLK